MLASPSAVHYLAVFVVVAHEFVCMFDLYVGCLECFEESKFVGVCCAGESMSLHSYTRVVAFPKSAVCLFDD